MQWISLIPGYVFAIFLLIAGLVVMVLIPWRFYQLCRGRLVKRDIDSLNTLAVFSIVAGGFSLGFLLLAELYCLSVVVYVIYMSLTDQLPSGSVSGVPIPIAISFFLFTYPISMLFFLPGNRPEMGKKKSDSGRDIISDGQKKSPFTDSRERG